MTKIVFDDRTLRLTVENLPALTGTEKQVAWAEDIRATAIAEMARLFDFHVRARFANDPAKFGEGVEVANKTFGPLIASKTEAKYWIDNRNTDIRSMAKKG